MKILVVIRKNPTHRFLVDLHTNSLIKEVSDLLAKRKNSQAIATSLSKGRFDREITEKEIHMTKADMILTEESVHWDLTR